MNITKYKILSLFCLSCTLFSCNDNKQEKEFPYEIPLEQPNFEVSTAISRLYSQYHAATPQKNELFTNFKYTPLEGLDYHNEDGTITRRDPSRIVKVNGKYYMWYTKRATPTTFVGAKKANDSIPSTDWDLCDIAYATSKDGFKWDEQGVAVSRPQKPNPGWRSVSTPEILVYKGKYYLYYQAFSEMSGKRGDDCPVAVSYADSPDGPWKATNKIVLPNGPKGSWDQYSIHDPFPMVYKDKIYIYYKSDYNGTRKYNGKKALIRSTGLAIGDNPMGPFTKCKFNPVISSGHETQLFRFKEGVAAIMAKDGHENNTIQYSKDGIHFNVAAITSMMPIASGLYDPDAFTNTDYAHGITWGISHYNIWGKHAHSLLLRFDCDLSLDVDDPEMKKNNVPFSLQELYKRGLSKKELKRIRKI